MGLGEVRLLSSIHRLGHRGSRLVRGWGRGGLTDLDPHLLLLTPLMIGLRIVRTVVGVEDGRRVSGTLERVTFQLAVNEGLDVSLGPRPDLGVNELVLEAVGGGKAGGGKGVRKNAREERTRGRDMETWRREQTDRQPDRQTNTERERERERERYTTRQQHLLCSIGLIVIDIGIYGIVRLGVQTKEPLVFLSSDLRVSGRASEGVQLSIQLLSQVPNVLMVFDVHSNVGIMVPREDVSTSLSSEERTTV